MTRSDVTKLHHWFSVFCDSYTRTTNEESRRNYLLKEEHTHHVVAAITTIAAAEGCSGDDLLLAETIGLLHDVGRFPQYRDFRTFKDADSVNHAVESVRVIQKEMILADLTQETRRLIIKCVALHNVYRIPEGLDDRTLYFLRLIRDADKLDIWRVFLEYYNLPEEERASAVGLGFPDDPGCSSEVLGAIAAGEMINLVNVKTLNDFKLLQLSWIYDLNFTATRRFFRERGYLEAFASALPHQECVRNALTCLSAHLNRSIGSQETVKSGGSAWIR